MRKILLATAAGFAAFVADGVAPARAQAGTDVTGQATPTPGITARFTGRYRMYMGYVDQGGSASGNLPLAAGVPAGANPGDPAVVTGGQAYSNSISNFDFADYARLFPGFDGVAANGLRYGASLEIRMGSGGNARGDGRTGLFYRRIWGYVGTPTLGQIRVGSGPTGAIETMTVGHITGFGSGGWDGDATAFIIGINPSDNFWFSSSSRNNYTKIGYFSPQFFGFDLGLSYGANNGNAGGDGSCSFPNLSGGAPQNCDRLSGTSQGSGLYNLRNIVEAMLRYRGTFGPVGVAASGGWSGNLSKVDNLNTTANPLASGISADKLSMWVGGATVSWAGLTVGGLLTGGQGNIGSHGFSSAGVLSTSLTGGGGLQPLLNGPGLNTSNFFGWEIGAQYTFGPFVVGAHYFNSSTEGNQAVAADRDRQGVAVGGTWNIAPGLAMFLEYLWGEVKENGVNLLTGAVNPANNSNFNSKVDVNVVSLGISFQW